ncbi:MAG: GNAT family N-acetyltransferase [Candidatus Thorarchaeota archaeon]
MVVEFPLDKRKELLPLFEDYPYLHAIPEALLKEGLGEAYTDSLDEPTVAHLYYQKLSFLAGDANSSHVSELLERISEKELIVVPSGLWEDELRKFWKDKLHPYPRTKFSSESLDIKHMKEIQKNLPRGMTLEEVNTESIQQVSDQAKGLILLVFPTLEKFLETNFGFMIREGDTVVSLALAATPLYSNEFEIHIETHPDYQRRGLAMISAARLIQYCLENGMIPHWDADNPPSAKLATKLGFTQPEEYNGYYWLAE